MKIGIIGAENSHSGRISHTLNVARAIRGVSVDYLWGETDAFARQRAKEGQIPNIVKSPLQMLGKIDALIVDHRHAKHHLRAAQPFLEAGIPLFIDKPFCYRAAEGKAFLKAAKKKGVPVTSYSTLPLQRDFERLRKKAASVGDLLAVTSFGPCDLASQYGGVFFYGIHQVEMVLEIAGYDVSSVLVTKNGPCSTGQLIYRSGRIAVLHFFKNKSPGFSMAAAGAEGAFHYAVKHDKDPYLAGIKTFTTMFRTGKEPRPHDQILKPVLVLEALQRSVRSGKRETVGR